MSQDGRGEGPSGHRRGSAEEAQIRHVLGLVAADAVYAQEVKSGRGNVGNMQRAGDCGESSEGTNNSG